ncbi:MAG: NAD(P)H-hydrate dehydratase, partial [Gemmiger qucibialis]
MHELNQHKIAALLPQRRAQSNKGSYGSVAAAAGSLAYRGAAALCVEGALRTGAGLVYLASVEPVIQLVLTRTPECCA